MANGSNPAAAIYDILVELAGEPAANINTTSFNDAADFWNSRGYGLNMIFTSQMDVSQMISKILGYVDGMLFLDQNGQWKLVAMDSSNTSDATISQDDMLDFTYTKDCYISTKNDFRATFVDEDLDYTNT